MNKHELIRLAEQLRYVYDIVRLVDPETCTVYITDETGKTIAVQQPCFSVWNKSSRCKNCISKRLSKENPRMEKFEIRGENVCHITSRYVEVEGKEFVLEIVSNVGEKTIIEQYGKEQFSATLSDIHYAVFHDSLTNLYNRRWFDINADKFFPEYAVAVLDIDNFKQINDTYGHSSGDEVLRRISDLIRRVLCEDDSGIRYGGDEFVILFRDKDPLERLERLRESVRNEIFPFFETITISGGLCTEGSTLEDYFEKADRSLYKAKIHKDAIILDA